MSGAGCQLPAGGSGRLRRSMRMGVVTSMVVILGIGMGICRGYGRMAMCIMGTGRMWVVAPWALECVVKAHVGCWWSSCW